MRDLNVLLSPHAENLLEDIVLGIAEALSIEDGLRWEDKLRTATMTLSEFPNIGTSIPTECFDTPPKNADSLRQIFSGPYRIVYEMIENEIHILSIRHARMLISEADTKWS
jgi:plasmid stabilization system protein ParE